MNIINSIRSDSLSDSEFVSYCEAGFDKKLDGTAHKLLSLLDGSDSRIISLSGPTCAGKTTVAKKLTRYFSRLGRRVEVISIDDYYFDLYKKRSRRSEEIDMESVKNTDLDELKRTIEAIDSNKSVRIPTYDFRQGMRTGSRTIECGEDCIYMFEGIQTLYPEISSVLGTDGKNSLFICPDSCIDTGYSLIDPDQLRLMRRIVRDDYFRASSPEFTLRVWQSVRDNEEKNIFPYAENIGLRIDTTMGYEPGIIVKRLSELLDTVGIDSPVYKSAAELSENIKNVKPISSEYLNDDSLYREFIKI